MNTDELKDRFGNTVPTSQAAAELRRLHAENEQLRQQLAGRGQPVAWGDVKIRPDGKRYCRAVYTTDQSNAGCSPLYTATPDTDALLDQALEALEQAFLSI